MRKYLAGIGLAGLLSLSACGGKPDAPEFDEKQLISVLIDVHVAEAAAQNLRGRTKDSVLNVYYEQIFQVHGMDRAAFEATMESLREDPVRLEALYSEVMKEMERREAAL